MADFLYNSSVSREDQVLVIDTNQIPGVQSVSVGYTNSAEKLKYLGMGSPGHIFNGRQLGKVDISAQLFSSDLFIQFTGSQGCNGGLFKRSSPQGVYFESGYLVSYSSFYSIESPPEINASFVVFSELGTSQSINVNSLYNIIGTQHPKLKTLGPGSVNFNNSIFDTNRVLSYSIDININRLPIYILGQQTPTEIKTSYPIDINCSFELEINDYNIKNSINYPTLPKFDNINLELNDIITNERIASYNFGNMLLLSENISASVNGNTRVKLNYQTFKLS